MALFKHSNGTILICEQVIAIGIYENCPRCTEDLLWLIGCEPVYKFFCDNSHCTYCRVAKRSDCEKDEKLLDIPSTTLE